MVDAVAKSDDVFVQHPVYGIGKFRKQAGVVRFFDGPAKDEIVIPVGDAALRLMRLQRHQRVWCFQGGTWRIGFVDEYDSDSGLYLVDFLNGHSEYAPINRLYVRWSQPVHDPVALLKTGTVESRFLHDRRTAFVRDVLRQRVAAQGLAGIWSSGVETHAHQVGAARRILADPVKRYLLADEVGLGKTVEAGMVLRQLLLDDTGDALVLVPDGLSDQWQDELLSKFRVDQFPDRVRVLPHTAIPSATPAERMIVIIDEVHRLTATNGDSDRDYRRLCEITHAAAHVLLLSATPVRSNEDGFLRMLHLLDPSAYPLDSVREFRHRVEIRDDLAQALAALSDDTPVMFLDEPCSALRQMLPHEQWLQQELDVLERLIADRDTDAVRAVCYRVRTQLAETHRIHRRMIRTRRSATLARLFPVRGRTLGRDWLTTDTDARRPAVLRMINDLRVELAALESHNAQEFFRAVLGRAMAPVIALADLAMALRGETGHDLDAAETASLTAFAGTALGISVADQIEAILQLDTDDDRLAAVVQWAWPYVGSHRVAVACSFPKTAEAAAQRLEAQFGTDRVVRLLSTMSAAERGEAARRFVDEPARAVIVMDRSGEEGINLQAVEDVLHLDLPVNIARIEQRLGRFDRWAPRGTSAKTPVRSTAFREQSEALDSHLGGWRHALDEGLSLFGESSATLQYVLSEVERDFLADAIDRGLPDASVRMAARRDDLDAQRRRIEGQDLLDAIEDRAEDGQLARSMIEGDRPDRTLSAFRGYAVKVLGFTEDVNKHGTRFGISTRRPPRVTESDVHKIGPDNLRRRYAHRRAMAVRGAGLLRWGEPIVDRFADLAMRDDRGRAFATEIHQPRREPGFVVAVFMFSIVIAADPTPVDHLRAVDQAAAAAASTRLGQLFPPLSERLWWRPGLGEPPDEVCRQLDTTMGDDLGSRPERLEQLTRGMSWPDQCEEAARDALRWVARRPNVQQHIRDACTGAKATHAQEEAVVQARRRAGADASNDPRILEAVLAAVEAPQMMLDSCGVVFLTGPEA
ncbi:protein DpdE [Micromonospora sp. NPDC048930]|uniref:protein DpdE n=1 Tax=Micromonospora sp. NPDC048930 TaxID=3364261 RepID=UPI003718BB2B